jgi:hypothetical protein
MMDICTREVPPKVGTEHHYAICWWVKMQKDGHIQLQEGDSRESGEHVATAS